LPNIKHVVDVALDIDSNGDNFAFAGEALCSGIEPDKVIEFGAIAKCCG